VREILSQAGRQFDPTVVEAFSSLDHHGLLSRVDQRELARAAVG